MLSTPALVAVAAEGMVEPCEGHTLPTGAGGGLSFLLFVSCFRSGLCRGLLGGLEVGALLSWVSCDRLCPWPVFLSDLFFSMVRLSSSLSSPVFGLTLSLDRFPLSMCSASGHPSVRMRRGCRKLVVQHRLPRQGTWCQRVHHLLGGQRRILAAQVRHAEAAKRAGQRGDARGWQKRQRWAVVERPVCRSGRARHILVYGALVLAEMVACLRGRGQACGRAAGKWSGSQVAAGR